MYKQLKELYVRVLKRGDEIEKVISRDDGRYVLLMKHYVKLSKTSLAKVGYIIVLMPTEDKQ